MKLSKSKLALAKVINENGGWVDGANFSSQDYDGWVYHFKTKPTIDSGSEVWNHGGCIGKGHFKVSKINNWHQTRLSREEYYHAYPKADADGWIEWHGVAKSPVSKGVSVDVKMKNGTQHFGQLIDDECWGDHWGDASIIAYRLHKPEVKPELCESVARSIPDPVAYEKLSQDAVEAAKVALMSESIEESKRQPTIEQLAQDYRNAKEYADRLQGEASDAWLAAAKVKGELIDAGNKAGLVVTPHEAGGVIPSSVSYRVGEAGV